MTNRTYRGPRTYRPLALPRLAAGFRIPVAFDAEREESGAGAYVYSPATEFSLPRLAAPGNLNVAARQLQRFGGEAPGPDGLRLDQLTPGETYELLRVLSQQLITREYQPGPVREVRIPKPDGRFRTLELQNLADRIVGKAWQLATKPFFQSQLPRLGQSTWQVLAELQHQLRTRNHAVIAIADVRNCFPSVRLEKVIETHHRLIADANLRWLVETMLMQRGNSPRTHGLGQGSPASPQLMELSLHHALDGPCQIRNRHPADPFLSRYADNICVTGRNHRDAEECLEVISKLLQPLDLHLKSEVQTNTLRNQELNHLGFELTWNRNQFSLRIPEPSFADLQESLGKSLQSGMPELPRQVLNGWVRAFGPAFTRTARRNLARRIHETCTGNGFRQTTIREIIEIGISGYETWEGLRLNVERSKK